MGDSNIAIIRGVDVAVEGCVGRRGNRQSSNGIHSTNRAECDATNPGSQHQCECTRGIIHKRNVASTGSGIDCDIVCQRDSTGKGDAFIVCCDISTGRDSPGSILSE